jgi:hypothetical protein
MPTRMSTSPPRALIFSMKTATESNFSIRKMVASEFSAEIHSLTLLSLLQIKWRPEIQRDDDPCERKVRQFIQRGHAGLVTRLEQA